MNIITRKEAKEQNLKRYFTGLPCIRGHLSEKETINGSCIECCAEKRRVALNARFEKRKAEGKKAYQVLNRQPMDRKKVAARKQAKAEGLKKFTMATPCKDGHIGEWYVSTGNCVECEKLDSRREYSFLKETKGREFSDAAVLRANRWQKNNQQRAKENKKRYQERHKEKIRLKKKENYQNNKEIEDARVNAYYAKHPGRRAVHSRNRKARQRNAEGKHTIMEIRELFIKQKGRCVYCETEITLERKQKYTYHADHIVALINGGTNDIKNIQLTCESCNLSKGTKSHFEFARQCGKLL